ncbi:MAG: hypothetical protein KDK39_12810 [Leptospiraceae bacterium]|nr:hypothetical protein [Leptospiraceae bacterium]
MWLRLGADEIVNMDLIASIKRTGPLTIEIQYLAPQASRTIRFDEAHDCEAAFERVIENLSSLGLAMQ